MSVQPSPSRPATKSIGAAFVDIVLTLAILVVVFLAFLIAPLVALAVAYLAYSVIRPRANKRRTTGRPGQRASAVRPGQQAPAAAPAAYGFGTGTSL
jgi:phosphate/sulfate permease